MFVHINDDIYLSEKIYVPRKIEFSDRESNVSLVFDEVNSSDITTLVKVLEVLQRVCKKLSYEFKIMFHRDVVIVFTIKKSQKNSICVFDRSDGKLVFSYSDYFNGTGIENFVSLSEKMEYEVSIIDEEVYMEPRREYYDVKVKKFMNYYWKELSKNCDHIKFFVFNLIVRFSSRYGTIDYGLIREPYVDYGGYNYISPEYVCEFLKYTFDIINKKVKRVYISPELLSGYIIDDNIYLPFGKFKVETYFRNNMISIVSDKEYEQISSDGFRLSVVDIDKFLGIKINFPREFHSFLFVDNKLKYVTSNSIFNLFKHRFGEPLDSRLYSLIERVDFKTPVKMFKIVDNFMF